MEPATIRLPIQLRSLDRAGQFDTAENSNTNARCLVLPNFDSLTDDPA